MNGKMKKITIYTVVTGGYDEVKQPLVTDERFDYVLFSDVCTESHVGVWEVRKLDSDIFSVKDSKRKNFLLSRYPKICSLQFLQQYEASLYIDGNIQISSRYVYDRCIALCNNDIDWGYIKHQYVDCAYVEMQNILGVGWVHDYDIINWYTFLRNAKFPEHYGLTENNIIFRRNSSAVRKVEEIWWWSIMNYVHRDQFSLMYAFWRTPDIKRELLLSETENAWVNNGHFVYTNHRLSNKVVKRTKLEQIRVRCWRAAHPDKPMILLIDNAVKYHHAWLYIHLWTVWATIRYGYKVIIEMMNCRIRRKK